MSASRFALLVSHRGSVASTFDSASICLGSTIGVALAVPAFDTMRLPLIFDAPFAGAPCAPRFLVMVFSFGFHGFVLCDELARCPRTTFFTPLLERSKSIRRDGGRLRQQLRANPRRPKWQSSMALFIGPDKTHGGGGGGI